MYSIGYSKSFFRNSINLSAVYQGNYVQNKNEQFANQTGAVPFKRTPSLGMYGLGSQLEPEVDILTATVTLSDGVYNVPANTSSGTINLGQNGNKYNNIGIQLFSSEKSVDTLYIYVKKNITTDTNLSTPAAWKVYKSNFNSPGNWTEVSILAVTISVYNQLDGIYRYGIKFFSEQNNLFFKAINMDTASLNDVLVTEIEAHGTDVIPRSGKLSDTTTFFTQGINLNAQIRPINRVTVALNYFLNRADEKPESVINSMAGTFSNIFSKSKADKSESLISDVTRTYGASTTWVAHKYLITTARFQRNEAFDNKDETDFKSNTYSLDFGSSPLPTLDTKLSLIRTYSYNFDKKQSTSNLYLLTIGSRLYRDVNMITDIGYTLSKTYATDAEPALSATNTTTKATMKYIRGVIDARLTSKLFGNISYGFSKTSGTTSASTNDGTLIITYRPGQFINLSGSLKIFDTNGDTTTAEGFIIDWLFLQAVRMNFNYEHANVQPDSKTIDSISSYVIWYITKFIDVQILYGYNRAMNSEKTEAYNIGGNLTCRFW